MATLGVVLLAAILGAGLTCLLQSLRKGLTGFAVAVLLLLLGAASTTALSMRLTQAAKPNGIDGGLTIKQGSAGLTVYLGNQLVSRGDTVHFTWDRLLGDAAVQQGLVMRQTGGPAKPTAAMLGGPSAAFMSGSPGPRNQVSSSVGRSSFRCGDCQALLRRADGTYDLLQVLELDVTNSRGERRTLLLPVRIRSAQRAVFANFRVQLIGISRTNSECFDLTLILQPGSASVPIPDQAKQQDLWVPAK